MTLDSEALFLVHQHRLFRYFLRAVGETDTARDLTQDVFVRVSRTEVPQVEDRQVKAWLFRIATNKANDLWRSRGRERNATEGLRLIRDGAAPHADHRIEGSEQEQKLRRAIEQLPENQKQVLLLRYYSELKFVEIAQMLGCPLNTALGRMHKAMLKLKQLMDA